MHVLRASGNREKLPPPRTQGCIKMNNFHLRLPEFGSPTPEQRRASEGIQGRLSSTLNNWTDPLRAIGCEHRAAFVIASDESSCLDDVDARVDPRSIKKIFMRHPIEPIQISWHDWLTDFSLDEVQLLAFSSSIIGSQAAFSSGIMGTHPGSGTKATLFAPLPRRSEWRERILDISKIDDPIFRGALYFIETVYCHPLANGNGRLARSLMYASLAADGLLRGPFIPFAPVFWCEHHRIASAFKHSTIAQDANAIVDAVMAAISFAVGFAESNISSNKL